MKSFGYWLAVCLKKIKEVFVSKSSDSFFQEKLNSTFCRLPLGKLAACVVGCLTAICCYSLSEFNSKSVSRPNNFYYESAVRVAPNITEELIL